MIPLCSRGTAIALLLGLVLALPAGAQEVAREQWLSHMRTTLPTYFCEPGSYFRRCFKVTAEQCEQTAASATRVCLQDIAGDLPETMVQPGDGTRFGRIIGNCAGTAYEIALGPLKSSVGNCTNTTNWQ